MDERERILEAVREDARLRAEIGPNREIELSAHEVLSLNRLVQQSPTRAAGELLRLLIDEGRMPFAEWEVSCDSTGSGLSPFDAYLVRIGPSIWAILFAVSPGEIEGMSLSSKADRVAAGVQYRVIAYGSEAAARVAMDGFRMINVAWQASHDAD